MANSSKSDSKNTEKMTVQEAGKVSGGNFKNDPERAAKAGSHSHDNDDRSDSAS